MHDDETSATELNLATHRDPRSVWERRGWNGTAETPPIARLLLAVGGGALAIHGMKRRGFAGSLLVSVGTTLGWWAITGRSPLPDVRAWTAGARERWHGEDPVHEASAESFPASDAPARTPATGMGVRRSADVH